MSLVVNLIIILSFISSPVRENLTGSLWGDLKRLLETVVSYWHWYDPSWAKSTLGMLKVCDEWLVDWIFLNEPEVCRKVKVPPKCWVAREQVMSTVLPQITSLTGFTEMLGFGRFTENSKTCEWGRKHLNYWHCIRAKHAAILLACSFLFQ